MKLLIMFAEMERKNIRMRVRDNYYARGEKGFYLGGYPPFGYKKSEIILLGKKTSGYEIKADEGEIVREIYHRISRNCQTASSICRHLNSKKILTKKGLPWTTSTLIRLVRNPFYVKADIRVFELICSLGGKITSEPREFNGENGLICYGNKNSGSRFLTFENCHVTVGQHKGIVDSQTWLNARKQLDFSKSANRSVAPNTYLTGLIFCERCGKKFTRTSSKGYTYFYCRGKKTCYCDTKIRSVRSDFLEKLSEKIIKSFLKSHCETPKTALCSDAEREIRGRLAQEKSKLAIAKERLKTADEREFRAVLETVISVEREISVYEEKLAETVAKSGDLCYTELGELARCFGRLGVPQKRGIALEIIEKIVVSEGKIQFFLKKK